MSRRNLRTAGRAILIVLAVAALAWLALLWLCLLPFRVLLATRGPGGGFVLERELLSGLIGYLLGSRPRGRTGPSWHPCEECGAPIDRPSRAAYCSAACRSYARQRRAARAIPDDEIPF